MICNNKVDNVHSNVIKALDNLNVKYEKIIVL